MKPVRLLAVDDHNLFRRGLVALLSQDGRFEVMGEAGDVGEALRCVERGRGLSRQGARVIDPSVHRLAGRGCGRIAARRAAGKGGH